MQQLTEVFETKRGATPSGDGSFSQELLHANRHKDDRVEILPESAIQIRYICVLKYITSV